MLVRRNPQDLSSPKLPLHVTRKRATERTKRLGVLVIESGPGFDASVGVRTVGRILPTSVIKRFDVLGITPRGTSPSESVTCGLAEFARERMSLNAIEAGAGGVGCTAQDIERLARMGSATLAEDIEAVRAALGEEQLSFVASSYGSFVASVYATRFPRRVQAAVFDGAVDPSYFGAAGLPGRYEAIEESLTAFLKHCAGVSKEECPFNNGQDLIKRYARVRAGIEFAQPEYGDHAFDRAVSTLVLDDDTGWNRLGEYLALVANRPPVVYSFDPGPNTRAASNAVAQHATLCSDGFFTRQRTEVAAFAAAFAVHAPRFPTLRTEVNTLYPCVRWPSPPVATPPLRTPPGAVMIVSSTLDPTTPIPWARALASRLKAPLITRSGTGHGALARSECLRKAAGEFLVEKKVRTSNCD